MERHGDMRQQNEQKLGFAYWSEVTPVYKTALTHVHSEVNLSVEACHMIEKTAG